MNTIALTDSQREQLRSALELRKEQLLQELDAVQRDTLAVASAARPPARALAAGRSRRPRKAAMANTPSTSSPCSRANSSAP